MSVPYRTPPGPPRIPEVPTKSRTGLYVGIACGCVLLLLIMLVVVGGGVWLFSSSDATAGREKDTRTSESASEDPSEEPTSEEPTEEPTAQGTTPPVESVTEDPTDDPSSLTASFKITVSPPQEGTTLETSTETLETVNGKFIGVDLTIVNDGDVPIDVDLENFAFIGTDGEEYPLRFGRFSVLDELPAGETATAQIYADVPTDMELEMVTYTEPVATGGEPLEMPVA